MQAENDDLLINRSSKL